MKHPYKTQLMLNLKAVYKDLPSRVISYFDGKKDEILFVMDGQLAVREAYDNVLAILSKLPEIDHPRERTVIGFCDKSGAHYCSHLINPNIQDEINLALIGYRSQRKVRPEELQEF